MMDKHKAYGQTRDPRTGRPPLPLEVKQARKPKTPIEVEENEDLEVDEGTEATTAADAGNPETPDNTGAIRKAVAHDAEFDDAGDGAEDDPVAIDEEMRNQDS
jgi:hypothetical protein